MVKNIIMSDRRYKSGDEKPSTTAALAEKTVTDEDVLQYEPSVTISVFVTWIIPVLLIAILTRFAVDKDAMTTTLRPPPPRPLQINLNSESSTASQSSLTSSSGQKKKKNKPNKAPTPVPTLIADKPSRYIEVVQAISRRRLDWEATDTGSHQPSPAPSLTAKGVQPSETDRGTSPSSDSKTKPKMKEPARGASSDPVRIRFRERIDQLRVESQVSQMWLSLDCLTSCDVR